MSSQKIRLGIAILGVTMLALATVYGLRENPRKYKRALSAYESKQYEVAIRIMDEMSRRYQRRDEVIDLRVRCDFMVRREARLRQRASLGAQVQWQGQDVGSEP